MEVLVAGHGYANLVAQRQALIADGVWLDDHVTAYTTTTYRPLADGATGNWTSSLGGSLYQACNEAVPDSGNYAQSGLTPSNDIMRLTFSAPGTRPIDTDHRISYVLHVQGTLDMTVRLKQGVNTRKTWTHSPAPTTPTRFDWTLSEVEAQTLTDGDALELEVEAG